VSPIKLETSETEIFAEVDLHEPHRLWVDQPPCANANSSLPTKGRDCPTFAHLRQGWVLGLVRAPSDLLTSTILAAADPA
jgi:hypothetical protein